jgi:hypothetical protein
MAPPALGVRTGVKTERLRVVSLFLWALKGLFVAALDRLILATGEGEAIPDILTDLTIGEEKCLDVEADESMVPWTS